MFLVSNLGWKSSLKHHSVYYVWQSLQTHFVNEEEITVIAKFCLLAKICTKNVSLAEAM